MKYEVDNDNELLFMVKESDEDALVLLINKYKFLVNLIVKKHLSNTAYSGLEKRDLIQEGLVGLIKAIKTYKEDKNAIFYTYATVCIESHVKNAIRSYQRKKNEVLNNSLSLDYFSEDDIFNFYTFLSDEDGNPINKIIDKETEEEIINGLNNTLTDFEKQVFNLKLNGLSNPDISIILSVDKRSIENTTQRIKQKYKILKDKLESN